MSVPVELETMMGVALNRLHDQLRATNIYDPDTFRGLHNYVLQIPWEWVSAGPNPRYAFLFDSPPPSGASKQWLNNSTDAIQDVFIRRMLREHWPDLNEAWVRRKEILEASPSLARDREARRQADEQRAQLRERETAQEAERVAAARGAMSWGGFTDDMTPLKRQRAHDILSKEVSLNDTIGQRGVLIAQLVSQGRRVVDHPKWGRLLQDLETKSFFREPALTKVGMNYAEYLARQV